MLRRTMDHSRAPLLEAMVDYHRQDRYGFTPPGHRQGRSADPRARALLGADTYRAGLPASGGLDAGMVLPDPADPSLETIRVTVD